jgi:hypothetical protein
MAKGPKASAAPHPWSSDALLGKAQRYAELMLEHAKDDWRFALWSSLALEFLLRAALARISRTLLADRQDWNNLYFALGHVPRVPKFVAKSIGAVEVATRLEIILTAFTPEMKNFCIRHLTTRNEELHTGAAAFEQLGAGWMPSYYAACDVLLESLDQDLAFLVGESEAKLARALVKASKDESAKAVKRTISQFTKAWKATPKPERETLTEQALVWATRHDGHRVVCPACSSAAIITGSPAGEPVRTINGDIITEKQHFLPAYLECVACRMTIGGLSQLAAAGLGDGFTSTTLYEAAELYAQEPEYEPDFNEM